MYIFDSVIGSFILFLSVHEKKKVIVDLRYSVVENPSPSMRYIVVLYWHKYNKKKNALNFTPAEFESSF